jgi:AcrR family transcriptional regulator
MNRREHKKKIRKLLQQKALELFKSQGYQKTTILQITKSAGVAKGTFFNYFRTKEEVLRSINDWLLNIIETEIHSLADTENFTRKLCMLLKRLAKLNEELGKELTKSLFHIAAFSDNVRSQEQLLRDSLLSFFEQGQVSGEIRKDLPTAVIASAFSQLYFGVLHYWSMNPSSPPLTQLIENTFIIFFDGIKGADY